MFLYLIRNSTKIYFMALLNNIFFHKRFKTSKRFAIFGLFNFFATQIILGLMLLFFPVYIATFFSQFMNIVIGYYVYSKYVFSFKKKYSSKSIILYLSYAILIWLINRFLIYFISLNFYINKNISAILILPLLVLLSYLVQKNIIFKDVN